MNLSDAIVGPLPEMQIALISSSSFAVLRSISRASFSASSQRDCTELLSKRILAKENTSPSWLIKAPFSEDVPMSAQKTASFTLFGFNKLVDYRAVVKKVAQRLVVVHS